MPIDSYTIVREIGRGGMGTVYLANTASGEQVALKVIRPELAQAEDFRARFRREVDAARRVRRFCTAAVLDAATDGDELFVATDYVPGPTLREQVTGQGLLAGADLEALAVATATALASIHSAGVIHRDLTPSNVILSPLGPRVVDFGIARPDGSADVTQTGHVIGTPNYLAPEVLLGQPVTQACDVFSWGCLIAFAGTGQAPFDAPTTAAIYDRVLHHEPDLSHLDADLRDVVASALAKDPAVRPAAQSLVDRLVGGETTQVVLEGATQVVTLAQVVTPGLAPVQPRPRKRVRLWIALAAVVVVLVAVGVVWLASGAPSNVAGVTLTNTGKANGKLFDDDNLLALAAPWINDAACVKKDPPPQSLEQVECKANRDIWVVDFEVAQSKDARDSRRSAPTLYKGRPTYRAFNYKATYPVSGAVMIWTDQHDYCHTYWDDDNSNGMAELRTSVPFEEQGSMTLCELNWRGNVHSTVLVNRR